MRSDANAKLEAFNNDPSNLARLKFFIESSQNINVQYLGASAIKTLLTDHWTRISMSEKVGVKNYLIAYLLNNDLVTRQDK